MDIIHKSKCLVLHIANVMDISRFCCFSYYGISKKNKCQAKHYKYLPYFLRALKAILCLLFKCPSLKCDKRFQILGYFDIKDCIEIANKNISILASTRREYPSFYFLYFHTSENNGDVTDSCYENSPGYLFNVRY